MGKLAFWKEDTATRGNGLLLKSRIERHELFLGQSMEKALQENCGFAEAGIDVEVHRIEDFPSLVGMQGVGIFEVGGSGG